MFFSQRVFRTVQARTEHGDGAGDEHGQHPDQGDLEADEPLGGVGVARLERVADAQVAAQGDEAHVHDGRRAGQDVAGRVHVAPHHAERPVTCNTHKAVGHVNWDRIHCEKLRRKFTTLLSLYVFSGRYVVSER